MDADIYSILIYDLVLFKAPVCMRSSELLMSMLMDIAVFMATKGQGLQPRPTSLTMSGRSHFCLMVLMLLTLRAFVFGDTWQVQTKLRLVNGR